MSGDGMWMNLVSLASYLLPLGSIWAGVLWIGPAVARAHVNREALLIRDRLIDGFLSGDIDPTNPRALDVVKFCEFVASRPDLIKMSRIQAVERAMKKAGIDVENEAKASFEAVRRQSNSLATEGGLRRIEECEREVDRLLANYLVRNTAAWPLLVPARWITRHLPELQRRIPDDQRPGVAAAELRAVSRGRSVPPDAWIGPSAQRRIFA